MNSRRRFHQRWLLWGLLWVFMLASLAPAISRMQAAGAVAASVQVAEVRQSFPDATGTICFPDEETAALPAQEEAASRAGQQRAAFDPHAGHGHHGGLTGDPGNLLVQLSMGMPSLDCCPFCSIMADRLAPVWFDLPLLLDRTLVRARPELREPMPPAVVILRLPPVRGPPAASPLSV